jgi:hypothetical protein
MTDDRSPITEHRSPNTEMLQRQVSQVSEPAWVWLHESRAAQVLALFERACTLVNGQGQLLSLVGPELGMGPFALMVAWENGRFTDSITPNATVIIQPDRQQLKVGNLTLHWHGAKRWQPRPAWKSVGPDKLAEHLPTLRRLLVANAPAGSLAMILLDDVPAGDSPTAASLLAIARPAIDRLLQGFLAADVVVCQVATRKLAGLGAGLTPAGDDFLVGAIYALWTCLPDAQAASLATAVAAEAAPLTTTLSAGWLAAAGRGEAGQPWHDLVGALAAGQTEAMQPAVQAILATGHTSGADALAGFLVAAACLTDG